MGGEKRQQARNIPSNRLTPKSSYGGAGKAGVIDAGNSSERGDSNYRVSAGQRKKSAHRSKDDLSAGAGSQVRQVRLSARPHHH